MEIKIEPDPEPRQSTFHRDIVRYAKIPGTVRGWLDLSCGHRVMAIGDIGLANGRVLCVECRNEATKS